MSATKSPAAPFVLAAFILVAACYGLTLVNSARKDEVIERQQALIEDQDQLLKLVGAHLTKLSRRIAELDPTPELDSEIEDIWPALADDIANDCPPGYDCITIHGAGLVPESLVPESESANVSEISGAQGVQAQL